MDPVQFDYVIVGAGSAGCVLANRLSENPAHQVCLIEAGPPDSNPLIAIPAGVAFTILNPKLGWGFKTTPQRHCNNREIPLPRGRVMGGCSSINGMVYFRGHPGDFEDWAAAGAPGWGYRDVLPYFIKSERNLEFAGDPYHGTEGPMNVISIPKVNPIVDSFVDAARSMQFPMQRDFNGADPIGFGPRQATIRGGFRESEVSAYIDPIKKRKNLTIITRALVHHVLLEQKRAVGVALEQDGEVRQIMARREVIFSGGAYGSPTLLLRSGIGPGEELRALGIEVRHDLPGVGKNLREHPSVSVQMRTKDTTSYGVSVRKAIPNALAGLQYLLFRSGPLAGNVFEGHGFVKSDPSLARPDLQIIMMPAHRNAEPKALPQGHGYGIVTALVKPKSAGTISLASADPHANPLIDLNLLSDPDDIGRMRTGLKLARRVLQNPAFDRYKGHEIVPGPQVQSDDEWAQFIRNSCVTVHHPTSSCRMGQDELSVVGPDLRVHGIDGLRVVDASIFPTLVAGNTNAPVVMVAEKASDMILGKACLPALDLPHAV